MAEIDLGNLFANNPSWQSALTMAAGEGPQAGYERARKNQILQIQLEEEQRNIEVQKAKQAALAQSGGQITPELALEIMQYDPKLGMEMLEMLQKQQKEQERQQIIQQYTGMGGGVETGSQLSTPGGNPSELAAIAAMTGDKELLDLAKFMQDQEQYKQSREDEKNKPLSGEASQKVSLANQGLRGIAEVRKLAFKPDGTLDKGLIKQTMNIPIVGPLKLSPSSQKYYNALYNMTAAKLRLDTGANAPEAEVRNNMSAYGPSLFDDDRSAAYKLDNLAPYFNDVISLQKRDGLPQAPVNPAGVTPKPTKAALEVEMRRRGLLK